jgi:flagellar basal-body rod protein FlgB
MAINEKNFNVIQKSLDVLWLRQRVISNNIANIDTPGYNAKQVDFENILSGILEETPNIDKNTYKEIDGLNADVVQEETLPLKPDGNNVDIDNQNVEMIRTQLHYQYMTRIMADEMSRVRYVINEGRR